MSDNSEQDALTKLYTAKSGAYTTAAKLAAGMKEKGFKTTIAAAKQFILSTKSGVSLQVKRGIGHFMPQYPNHQWQIDLVQIPGPQAQPMHLIAVDIASRRMAAVPISNKSHVVLKAAFKKIIAEMGGIQPETVYSDQESGFNNMLKEYNIPHLFTRSGHASAIESAIGHARTQITRAREARKDAGLPVGRQAESLQEYIKNHNANDKHYITQMTPEETEKEPLLARLREEIYHEIHFKNRPAPDLKEGDKVVVAIKRQPNEKRSTLTKFTTEPLTIDDVKYVSGVGNIYTIDGTEYSSRDLGKINDRKNIETEEAETITPEPTPTLEDLNQSNIHRVNMGRLSIDPDSNFKGGIVDGKREKKLKKK